MTDQVLDALKLVLLALLYLFFARVLWAVWSEVRTPRNARAGTSGRRPSDDTFVPSASDAQTVPAQRPRDTAGRRERRPSKGRGGRAARLVVVEPRARRGAAWAIDAELTIGRDSSCTISIPDDTFVSSLHARVFDHEGQPIFEDLGSTNGSFHNGNKLSGGSKLLQPGDRIQIGYTVLEAQ